LRVVTEAYMHRPETSDIACLWIGYIEEMLSATNATVSGEVELFIKIESNDCAYYLVDHANRTQFWLESSSTTKLGLGLVVSKSHLSA
jgi:hypothetical protein